MRCNPTKAWPRLFQRPAFGLLVSLIAAGLAMSAKDPAPAASDLPRAPAHGNLPFTTPPGFVAKRIAGPSLVEHPMFGCFDDHGRLFVADSRGINPKGEQLDKKPAHVIRLLQSSRGDGSFDKSTIFADKLTYPEGLLCYDGAVFTAAPPNVWRLDDTRGAGIADKRQVLVTGYVHTGIADELHGPSLGPDGRIYWGCGRFHHAIQQPGGKVLWEGKAPLIHRCRPDGQDLEVLCGAQGNPVKLAFSPEGEPFACGTWSRADLENHNPRFPGRQDVIIHCVAGGNYPMLDGDFYSPEFKHTPDLLPPLVYLDVAAASGVMRYEGDAFGAEFRDNLFSALFNLRKVQRHILERDGATYRSRNEDFLVSTSPDFHPTDVFEDADGSLIVVDSGSWFEHCPTSKIGKGQVKGGIYRICRQGASPVADPCGLALQWGKLSEKELVLLLGDKRFAVRNRAVQQLAKLGARAVPVLRDTLENHASAAVRRDAVWALTRMDAKEARAAVRVALADKDPSVRLTGVTSAGLWRDPVALTRLTELVTSDSPPIRREAATALGYLRNPAAVPALLQSVRNSGDRFLEHALIYSLIEIADREAMRMALHDPSADVRRGALIALDQMEGGKLTRDLVTPLLDPAFPALREAALKVLIARPEWAKELRDVFRAWLLHDRLAGQRSEDLHRLLLAYCRDKGLQELIALALRRDKLPTKTRLLLLETMAQTPLDHLPSVWIAELRWALDDADPRIVRQALANLRIGGVAEFDDLLMRLAADRSRPVDLRVDALATAVSRIQDLDDSHFALLTQCLDREQPPLLRLSAAGVLNQAPLSEDQLDKLTGLAAAAGPLELSRLLAAYERSTNPAIGKKLLSALARAPGFESLSAEVLRRTLRAYPAEIRRAAQPLLKRLEPDADKQKARLAELTPLLHGGDAGRGREVFFSKKALCFTCHTVRSQGGQVGPDLTKIGGTRSGPDLLEAIVFPSASFARGFEPFVVATRSGKSLAGILKRQTADAIYLVNTDRAETRIPRSEIEALEPGKVSLMPQGLDTQLGRQELADLLAFLQSLR
jgi:putative membrane-bound dehydrogenase-like protein